MTQFSPVLFSDLDLIVAMMAEFYAIDGYPIDQNVSRRMLSEFIGDEKAGKAWLIKSDGDVVGYVIMTFVTSFEFKGKIAFIDELYIRESARRRGIGKAAIGFVKNEAQLYGVKMLYLEVEHHNAIAFNLYSSAGFETHRRKFMQFRIR
jgi:ribosomal protein S18 acetylase RimI-like enzyme